MGRIKATFGRNWCQDLPRGSSSDAAIHASWIGDDITMPVRSSGAASVLQ